MMIEDHQLLAEYVAKRSDSAFGELVNRHIDLVFSAALRMTQNDRPLAQDVTQTVFADLARKAAQLPTNVVLPGWLYRHTCFTASKAIRTERRRQAREQIALEMNALENQPEAGWDQIAPQLEDAMNGLSDDDRDALVLRFFQRRDFRAVGATLGISEDAAQKRVTRALDKLRDVLGARGVGLAAVTLGAVLTAKSVTAAPVGLAATVTTIALAGATAAGAGATWSLIKFMSIAKVQWGIVGLLAVTAVSIPVLQNRSMRRLRQENDALRQENGELRIKTEDMGKFRAQNPGLKIIPVDSNELARLRKGQSDVLRLRGEVTTLRNKTNELAAAASPKPPIGPFISAAKFNDAGLGTPEDAVQTFFWAAMHNNKDRMEQAVDTNSIKKLLRDMQKQYDPDFDPDDPDGNYNIPTLGLTNNMELFGGFQVLSVQSNSPDQFEVEAALTGKDGTAVTNRAAVYLIDGDWKVDFVSLVGTNVFDGSYTLSQPDGSQMTNNFKFKVQQTKEPKFVPTNLPDICRVRYRTILKSCPSMISSTGSNRSSNRGKKASPSTFRFTSVRYRSEHNGSACS